LGGAISNRITLELPRPFMLILVMYFKNVVSFIVSRLATLMLLHRIHECVLGYPITESNTDPNQPWWRHIAVALSGNVFGSFDEVARKKI